MLINHPYTFESDEKQAQEKERQQWCEQRDPNEPFVGSLNSRDSELQDIECARGLEIEGRVEDLKSSINAYLDENKEQRTSHHYIGLFPQLALQAHQAVHALVAAARNQRRSSPPRHSISLFKIISRLTIAKISCPAVREGKIQKAYRSRNWQDGSLGKD